jgi:hypothetical protein
MPFAFLRFFDLFLAKEFQTDFIKDFVKAEGTRQCSSPDLALLLVVPSREMRYKTGEHCIGDLTRAYQAGRNQWERDL